MIGYKVTYRPPTDNSSAYWTVKNLQTGKSYREYYDYAADNPRRAAVENVAGVPVTYIGDHSRGSYFVAAD